MKTIIASPKAPKAVGPYSQASKVRRHALHFGTAPDRRRHRRDARKHQDQTRQSLTNLGHILEEAGYSHADIVKTTVLLTDIADFAAMNAVYATFFTKDMPARHLLSGIQAADGCEGRDRCGRRQVKRVRSAETRTEGPRFAPIKTIIYTRTTRDSALFSGLVRNRLRSACICANPTRRFLSGRRENRTAERERTPTGSIKHRATKLYNHVNRGSKLNTSPYRCTTGKPAAGRKTRTDDSAIFQNVRPGSLGRTFYPLLITLE